MRRPSRPLEPRPPEGGLLGTQVGRDRRSRSGCPSFGVSIVSVPPITESGSEGSTRLVPSLDLSQTVTRVLRSDPFRDDTPWGSLGTRTVPPSRRVFSMTDYGGVVEDGTDRVQGSRLPLDQSDQSARPPAPRTKTGRQWYLYRHRRPTHTFPPPTTVSLGSVLVVLSVLVAPGDQPSVCTDHVVRLPCPSRGTGRVSEVLCPPSHRSQSTGVSRTSDPKTLDGQRVRLRVDPGLPSLFPGTPVSWSFGHPRLQGVDPGPRCPEIPPP